ncbi:MAG: SEC-C domain-containing protein [Spirochaetales bacterium]|nr:SEC-C domain-containing protein [Spirochaetales bacterium]
MSNEDYLERLKTTGRNDSCPCGSGKKYKKCHLPEDEAARSQQLKKEQEEAEAETKAAAEKEEAENAASDKVEPKTSYQHKTKASKHVSGQKAGATNLPRRSAMG